MRGGIGGRTRQPPHGDDNGSGSATALGFCFHNGTEKLYKVAGKGLSKRVFREMADADSRERLDGFYAGYITGNAGVTTLLFALQRGRFVGVDVGGLKYDGVLEEKRDGSGYTLSLVYVIPPGASLITGASPPETTLKVPLSTELPLQFADGRVIGILTPLGPVNARFEKLRDLPLND